jgi:hypothetical protein
MFGKNSTHGYKVIEGGANRPREVARTPGIQETLFPFPESRSLIFVRFSDVSQNQFTSLIENLRPSFVIDLRRVPRFDVGRLNRQLAFQLFMKNQCIYLDFSTVDESRSQKLMMVLRKTEAQPKPILFLTDGASGKKIDESVVKVFSNAEKKWRIYEFPSAENRASSNRAGNVRLLS